LQSLQNAPSPNRERESFLHITASSGEDFTFLGGNTSRVQEETTIAAATPSSAGSGSTSTQKGRVLRRGSQLNRRGNSPPEQPSRTSYSALGPDVPESSRHLPTVSNIEGPQFRIGEGFRPYTADDFNSRSKELSIVHETSTSHTTTPKKERRSEGRTEDENENESPTRQTLSSLKRPTFGSASFEAFRSSFPVPSEVGPLSSTTRDSGSGYGSPTSPSEYGGRHDPSRLPRSSFGARSRVRSSSTNRSLERKGKEKEDTERGAKGKNPVHLPPHDQPPSST
jgi:hypothetical protein